MKLNIRTRLTVQFVIIVASILIAFTFSIYLFSSTYRKAEFFKRLEQKALTSARLLLEVKEVDHDLLKIIDRNSINAMFNEKVVIYNYLNEQIYNSLDDDSIHVSEKLLDKIRLEKNISFHQGKYEVVGLLYTDRYNRFVVIASALDIYGRGKLNNLKWILIIGFFISNLIALLVGYLYAGRALKPMSDVVKHVDKISISNLNSRIDEGNGTDEIAQLAITFNKMQARLESAFELQRSFVSNASHELRTPLTSMHGHIEVSLMKTRTCEEYISVLKSNLEDTRNLVELSNRLLTMARANSDISEISFNNLRVDELLYETRSDLIARKKDYVVTIQYKDTFATDDPLTIQGNEHLLKSAFLNIMDNACKYSPQKAVDITLSVNNDSLEIDFEDKGIGISEKELKFIFQPFFRGTNARNLQGHGLGLSLTERIIHIHKGNLRITSAINIGTNVKVSFPLNSKVLSS